MPEPDLHLSRRNLLIAGAAAGSVGLTGLPARLLAPTTQETIKKMEPKLVHVPTEADIQKALNTASKGISEATHKNHLTLWQGYANKTNEIRKALAEFEVDPTKANQIYSQMR